MSLLHLPPRWCLHGSWNDIYRTASCTLSHLCNRDLSMKKPCDLRFLCWRLFIQCIRQYVVDIITHSLLQKKMNWRLKFMNFTTNKFHWISTNVRYYVINNRVQSNHSQWRKVASNQRLMIFCAYMMCLRSSLESKI